MKWEPRLDDPIPTMVIEALARAAMKDSSPCSICRSNAKLMKKPGVFRTHFHASDVPMCMRRLLYSLRFPDKAKPWTSPEFLRDGHLFEHSLLSGMAAGFEDMELEELDIFNQIAILAANNQEELVARIPYADGQEMKEMIIVGHWDGMMVVTTEKGDEVFLLECKAVKPEKFLKTKNGYLDKEWYGQMQTYMKMLTDHFKGKMKVEKGYLIVKNRMTSQTLPPIPIDFDSNYLKKRRDKLVEVHKALSKGTMVPREHKNKKNDECKWCRFADLCWGLDSEENAEGVRPSKARQLAKTQPSDVPSRSGQASNTRKNKLQHGEGNENQTGTKGSESKKVKAKNELRLLSRSSDEEWL